MPERLIFGILGFIVGCMGGFFAGSSLASKGYKKKIDQLEKQCEDVKKEARATIEEVMGKREKAVEEKYKEIIAENAYADEEDEDIGEENEKDTVAEEKVEEIGEDGYSLLTKQQYDIDINCMQTEHLMFYQEDGILADEFDEMIANARETIGPEAFEKCMDTNESFVYVRNDYSDMAYEIEINPSESFYRDLGV